MLTPEELHAEMKEYNEFQMKLVQENPWLIPASIALTTIPMAICVHGFWKNRQLSKKLKIEREKTKQLVLGPAITAKNDKACCSKKSKKFALGHHEDKNYRPFKFH